MKKEGIIQLMEQLLAESRAREKALEARANQAESESKELRRQIRELQGQLNHVIQLLEKSNETSERLANELKLYSPKKCERIIERQKEQEVLEEETDASTQCQPETSPDGQSEGTEAETSSRWSRLKPVATTMPSVRNTSVARCATMKSGPIR